MMNTEETVTDFDGLRFVVARYNEDVEWVPKLLSRFPGAKCTIYNKGVTETVPANGYEVLTLENVGRESHTYLHHIVESYKHFQEEGADKIIVFLQGDPLDHCVGSSLFDRVHAGVLKIMTGSGFEDIGTNIIQIINGVPTFHPSIREELAQTSQDLFETALPNNFQFSAGALFAVSVDCISNRPVSFYEKAIGMLDSDVNPVRGFCFERLWSLIFR